MHVCRKAFAVTGHSPNTTSGHVCSIRRSGLQSKKNACFWRGFLLLEGFPASAVMGAEQAHLGQLTFCMQNPLTILRPQCMVVSQATSVWLPGFKFSGEVRHVTD